ncbi:MAG: DUF5053 domain-containing protein [Muribaculaceae bacterium]|nr:DUF5053 domain-containing protein [Muribaculaceae bacterium]
MEAKEEELIVVRGIVGAEVLDYLSCAGISERFFQRSRAWFTQRLNNNIVNGKPIGFRPEELFRLRKALKEIASEIVEFTRNIPNIPTDLAVKVYVVRDRNAIEYILNDDVDGFRSYLADDPYLDLGEPECFDTEVEALAFCAGIGYGMDELNPEVYALRSTEEGDMRFIEVLME